MTLDAGQERWFTFTIREDRLQGIAMGKQLVLTNGEWGPYRRARHRIAAAGRICGLARGARCRRPRHQQLPCPLGSCRRGYGSGAGNDRVGGAQRRCFAIGHASSILGAWAWRRGHRFFTRSQKSACSSAGHHHRSSPAEARPRNQPMPPNAQGVHLPTRFAALPPASSPCARHDGQF